jgi:hypothetical protein
MLGFALLIVLVAMGIFQLGLRRYESGNLLGMKGRFPMGQPGILCISMATACPRASRCHADTKESQVLFEPAQQPLLVVSDMFAFAQAVPFTRIDDQFGGNILFAQCTVKSICLPDWHAIVPFSMSD